jgi:hypothetical protein
MKLQVADGKERLGEETRKESATLSLSAARRAILKGPENGFWSILIYGLILTPILSLLYLYRLPFSASDLSLTIHSNQPFSATRQDALYRRPRREKFRVTR